MVPQKVINIDKRDTHRVININKETVKVLSTSQKRRHIIYLPHNKGVVMWQTAIWGAEIEALYVVYTWTKYLVSVIRIPLKSTGAEVDTFCLDFSADP